MTENTKKQSTQLKSLLNDIQNKDPKKVAAAIKSLHLYGDTSVIIPLLDLWSSNPNSENAELIHDLIADLKETNCVKILMNAFRDEKYSNIKRSLTQAFWNSNLNFSAYLSDFVLFAIEGDFLDSFEALTLIEQFEGEVSESSIMESQLLLKEYFGASDRASNEQKDSLLSDLAIKLKDLDESNDYDDFSYE